MENNSFESSLKLVSLLFDKIYFERKGSKNSNAISYKFGIEIGQNISEKIYKVSLSINVDKKDEYNIFIVIVGLFKIFKENIIAHEELLKQNEVSILMLYLRSQISLITAQPEVDCVVLPPFNIVKMMSEN